ncbi:MAG: alpha/beta fold hydrolase [Christensenellales bacterium]|jgi:pimeloyl-ACP methyl ester carboxylesterase
MRTGFGEIYMHFELFHINIGGYNIAYIAEGDGPLLLLLHNIGDNSRTFRHIIPMLSKRFTVVAPDLLGFGYSEAPQIDRSIDNYASFLGAFIAELGIQPFGVIAASLSSAYAIKLLHNETSGIQKALFISPGGITPAYPAFIRKAGSGIFRKSNYKKVTESAVREYICDGLFNRTLANTELVSTYYSALSTDLAKKSFIDTLADYDDSDIPGILPAITQQTLAVFGEKDIYHPAESDYYANALPGCRTVLIKNCGHFVQEEKPERLVDAAMEFFGDV